LCCRVELVKDVPVGDVVSIKQQQAVCFRKFQSSLTAQGNSLAVELFA
jgi:hypothetical protein